LIEFKLYIMIYFINSVGSVMAGNVKLYRLYYCVTILRVSCHRHAFRIIIIIITIISDRAEHCLFIILQRIEKCAWNTRGKDSKNSTWLLFVHKNYIVKFNFFVDDPGQMFVRCKFCWWQQKNLEKKRKRNKIKLYGIVKKWVFSVKEKKIP